MTAARIDQLIGVRANSLGLREAQRPLAHGATDIRIGHGSGATLW